MIQPHFIYDSFGYSYISFADLIKIYLLRGTDWMSQEEAGHLIQLLIRHIAQHTCRDFSKTYRDLISLNSKLDRLFYYNSMEAGYLFIGLQTKGFWHFFGENQEMGYRNLKKDLKKLTE